MRMNPEVKQQWVDALRSGQYKQTYGALRKEEHGKVSYCALGVLTDIAFKSGAVEPVSGYDYTPYGMDWGYIAHDRLIPQPVADWADLGDFATVELEVMRANDNQGASFKKIAEWIEDNA